MLDMLLAYVTEEVQVWHLIFVLLAGVAGASRIHINIDVTMWWRTRLVAKDRRLRLQIKQTCPHEHIFKSGESYHRVSRQTYLNQRLSCQICGGSTLVADADAMIVMKAYSCSEEDFIEYQKVMKQVNRLGRKMSYTSLDSSN